MERELILVDMDRVVANYDQAHAEARTQDPQVTFPQGKYGFFLNIEPMPGAVTAIQTLVLAGFDVCFLTRPSVFNPLSYTEKRAWIEKWFGFDLCYNLILCYDKTMVRGDYLIDDNLHHYTGKRTGRFQPAWRLLHFGTELYPDWNAILNKLL